MSIIIIHGKNESDFVNFLCYYVYHWKVSNGAIADKDTDANAEATSAKTYTTLEADSANEFAELSEGTMEPRELDETFDGGDDDADEKSASDELDSPPCNYLPVGFIYFMTIGPLADKEYRVDIFTEDAADIAQKIRRRYLQQGTLILVRIKLHADRGNWPLEQITRRK